MLVNVTKPRAATRRDSLLKGEDHAFTDIDMRRGAGSRNRLLEDWRQYGHEPASGYAGRYGPGDCATGPVGNAPGSGDAALGRTGNDA